MDVCAFRSWMSAAKSIFFQVSRACTMFLTLDVRARKLPSWVDFSFPIHRDCNPWNERAPFEVRLLHLIPWPLPRKYLHIPLSELPPKYCGGRPQSNESCVKLYRVLSAQRLQATRPTRANKLQGAYWGGICAGGRCAEKFVIPIHIQSGTRNATKKTWRVISLLRLLTSYSLTPLNLFHNDVKHNGSPFSTLPRYFALHRHIPDNLFLTK